MSKFIPHSYIGKLQHGSLVRSAVALFLLIVLPVFLWAVLTQRIELRKKAGFSGPTLSMVAAAQLPNGFVGEAGQEFPAAIELNPNTATVSGVVLNIKYDPQIIQVEQFTPGSALPKILAPVVIATDSGTVSVTLGAKPDSPLTVPATIGVLVFRLINNTPTNISFDSSTIVSVLGQDTNGLAGTTGITINGTPSNAPAPVVCWNRVRAVGVPVWPDSCRGKPYGTNAGCAQGIVNLTQAEQTGYRTWTQQGRKVSPICNFPTPTYTQQAECYTCNTNTDCASGLICQQYPTPTPYCPNGPNSPCSQPLVGLFKTPVCVKPDGSSICNIPIEPPISFGPTPTPTACTGEGSSCAIGQCPTQPTCPAGRMCPQYLIACKRQNGICTHSLCLPVPPNCYTKTMECLQAPCPLQIVCPTGYPTPTCRPRPACLDATPPCLPPITNDMCPPNPTPSGNICTGQPNGTVCGQVCTNSYPSNCYTGTCQNNQCIYGPTPTPSPSPIPPQGCYYQQVQCFRAPCPPLLICPTGYPTTTPAPFIHVLTPNGGEHLVVGQNYTISWQASQGIANYSIYLVNSLGEESLINGVSAPKTSYTWKVGSPIMLNTALHKIKIVDAALGEIPSSPQGISANYFSIVNPNATPTQTPSPTPTPAPQSLQFKVKLTGVTGNQAEGAKINVIFDLQNGSPLQLNAPLALSYVSNGVYQATATLTNPLPVNTAFTVRVKGEKHVAVRFCKFSGQTAPCALGESMAYGPSGGTIYFDFTGIPLPPGDLNQDGKVDATDIKLLTNLFAKTPSQLTAADYKLADVDYSGTIDLFDLNLILQTLSVRYDQ